MANWYKGNLHSHTTETDGQNTPSNLVSFYKNNGYQFLAITDHNLFDAASLATLRAAFEAPEQFMLMAAEEVTLSSNDDKLCHLNGWGVSGTIPATPGATLPVAIKNNAANLIAANVLFGMNHPVFVQPADLLAVPQMKMLEIFNLAATGEAFEVLWDGVLTGGQVIYGVAADDCHTPPGDPNGWANPGTGWTVVRAASLSSNNIIQALSNGDFYSTNGVILSDVRPTQSSYSLDIVPVGGITYLTEFFGANGQTLAATASTNPSYSLNGTEQYVRARVRDSAGRLAWTQPMFRDTSVPVISVSVSPATVSLTGGQTQSFAATVTGSVNQSVTWSLSPARGSISAAGLYTAPATIPADQVVTVRATSAADPGKSDTATVSLSATATVVTVQVAPLTVSLNASGSQQFTATVGGTGNQAVTWSLSPAAGSISAAGLYSAPPLVTADQSVTVTATSSQDPSKSANAAVQLTATAVGSFVPIRMHAGTTPVIDENGEVWSPDAGFSANSQLLTTTMPIANTGSPAVYQTERYCDSELDYNVPVPNGLYDVTLKFAELFYTTAGERAFNVSVNGIPVLADFDVLNDTGTAFAATDYGITLNVTTGSIAIRLEPVLESPAINAIQITASDSAPASAALETRHFDLTCHPKVLHKIDLRIPSKVQVTLGVSIAALKPSESRQFRANVKGAEQQRVVWSVRSATERPDTRRAGLILRREFLYPPKRVCPCSPYAHHKLGVMAPNGVYTAPQHIREGDTVILTATSAADPRSSASIQVRLLPATGHQQAGAD